MNTVFEVLDLSNQIDVVVDFNKHLLFRDK